MRKGGSNTAQYVAQTRAVLHARGVIDDPYAAPMLGPSMRAVTALTRLPVLRRYNESPLIAALAARTVFFDRAVTEALDAGVAQVVILGAGYDSRAWRFARPGAAFFEVDHPLTQPAKRRRAPAGGPTYVAADLTDTAALHSALADGKFAWDRPAIFVIEGVTMYLARERVAELLRGLAMRAAPGSRLAVNFGAPPATGSRGDRLRQNALRLLGAGRGEPHVFFLTRATAGPFVADTGWRVERATSLFELAPALVGDAGLPIAAINRDGAVVSAATFAQ
jgi:methyltransferase (TIGR00027 family)